MPSTASICSCALAAALVLPAARASDGPAEAKEAASVSFHRQIRPIFQEHCQGCHQPAKAGGRFVISDYGSLVKGGRSGESIIVPGRPEESLLFKVITPQDGEPPEMPKKQAPLSEAKIELIRAWILAGAADDSPASVKVLVSQDEPPVYTSPPVVTSLDFSPDGELLAVSGYHEVLLHRADGSGMVGRLVGLSERIESAVFSPDGQQLAVTGGLPGRMGEVQVWDVESRRLRLSVPVTYDTVYGASWSPDGALIAFGCADNSLRAIDSRSGQQVLFQGAHSDWVLDTVFSADSSHLVSVSRDRSMKLVQVKTEQFIDNITSITPGALKGGLMALDRHPAKDELLAGGADGVPKIYRMHREKARQIGDDFNLIRQFEPLPGRIFDARYSPEGGRIVVGSSSTGTGEVRVYDTADGKRLWSYPSESAVYAVAFGADGKIVAAGGFDGMVRLLEAEKGELVKAFLPVPLSVAGEKTASASGAR
jgi:WD40 repeat protein